MPEVHHLEEKRLLAATLAAAPDLLLVVDPDGVILGGGGGREGSFGPPADLERRAVGELFHVDARARVSSAVASIGAGDTNAMTLERVPRRHPDGSMALYEVRVTPIEGSAWGDGAMLMSIRDITAGAASRTADEEAIRSLETSNQELEAFAAIAAHDLQEPLRKIRAFSDRVRSLAADAMGDDALGHLDRVDAAAARMQTLIGDILSLARVARGPTAPEVVDLGELLRSLRRELDRRPDDRISELTLEGSGSVMADPSQLRQLFANLVGNALKYRHPDRPPEVVVTCAVGGDRVEVTVADNGIGFDDKYVDKIFLPFERLHGHAEYAGTGVGLALCRTIVDRHGGRITAHGVPGEGSTFTFDLPSAP